MNDRVGLRYYRQLFNLDWSVNTRTHQSTSCWTPSASLHDN